MDRFHENLKKLILARPEDEKVLVRLEEAKHCPSVSACTADSGVPNLKYKSSEDSKASFFLHSANDPLLEAKEWFAALNVNQAEIIYIYGIGLGYYYEAALDWLKENRDHYLVFLEDDAEVMRHFMETVRATEMLDNPQVLICHMGSNHELVLQLSGLSLLFSSPNFVFSELKSYQVAKNIPFIQFKSTLAFLTSMNGMLQTEMLTHGVPFFRNFYRNYLEVPNSYFANRLFGKFKGVPAIICGAGPSLNKNMDVLATLSDRALIFAGGTALNALNGKGVMPHFGCGIDPNNDQFTRLVMNHAFEMPFFYRCRMLHEALEMVHGDRLFMSGSGGYEIGKWFEKKMGIEENELQEGFNVLNFSVMIAQAMGCNPIICVGIDLAYSDGESYAAGVTNHPVHNRKSNFRTKSLDDELITKNDIYGKPVNTLWKWIAESLWYTNFTHNHPDSTLINATEGGIGFLEVPNMTLEEVKQTYLDKQLDLKTRLHGEIQNSPLPESFNEDEIVTLMRYLMESLSRSGEACQQLVREHGQRMEKSGKETIPSESMLKEEGKLQEEPAYEVILKKFNDEYLKSKELVSKRLEADKAALSEQEYASKKALLEFERYTYLKDTACLNASIIKYLLNQREKKHERMKAEFNKKENAIQMLRQLYSIPLPKQDEIYFFDEKTFKISDPELQLDYVEMFSGEKNLRKDELFYPSNKIKFKESYLDGILHGPSTFYAENGSVLSSAWFIHGKQEGKMWTYYPDGSLHSLQRFDKGLPIGLHQYFYPDGLPKSILPYKKGALHGEVHLYSPLGILTRRLSFVEGKRNGHEQIWNDEGQLVIECQYENDRPIGISRTWYPTGVLAQEFLYDKDSRRIEAREWNSNGELVNKEGSKDDYFDQMSKETNKLTASLSEVVSKMSLIAPLVTEKNQNDQKDLASELAKLKHELENLQSIDSKLKMHVEQQENDPKEALWKTPASRQFVEKQFEEKREKMNHNIEEIQKGLKAVIKSLSEGI